MDGVIRQGDVLLVPLPDHLKITAAAQVLRTSNDHERGLVIAEGEHSGHFHAIKERDGDVLELVRDEDLSAQVASHLESLVPGFKAYDLTQSTIGFAAIPENSNGADMAHDEHSTAELQGGKTYMALQQRESVGEGHFVQVSD